ncbi:Pycsar system effector family protein [Aurantiacibacter sp. MUD61]|uniref:Pycsar system effector family protein n=1 Tax=Aurantiacibacter sp. MUD61 TaxID=3009083 RepID=UPI0022F05899|nr:Pycsar system effector family protein [Aurantiacibacter sp. MUD61]
MADKSLRQNDSSGTSGHGTAASFSPNAVHMLRTVQNNTLMLSQMADQKASILMGATFLVFSICVSRSLTGELPWSLGILALFAFLSSMLAVLAVLPSVSRPRGKVADNPLFFGHFTAMDEGEWTGSVLEKLEADETVFRAMLHDIYQNGQVLQRRKYRYLGYAYRAFIVGLIVTLVVFGIEFSANV